ncbi:M48 family metallopeptidase [Calditrichota bacterium LG25]
MNTDKYTMDISNLTVAVVRKDIKNLHIGVYPPDGHVKVTAPIRMDKDSIRLAVITRLDWIRKKQKAFGKQIRESKREMISGESHYVEGRRLRLNVIENKMRRRPVVRLKNHTILEMEIPPNTDRDERERILERWYRRRLREKLPLMLEKWEKKIGVHVNEVRIKKMKTKWGSCNVNDRRIWLNLELAKKPVKCLEYILVHEMVHLLERNHTERFTQLMSQLLPNWKLLRDELNRAPLAYAEWHY